MKRFLLTLLAVGLVADVVRADHPQVLVTSKDREAIKTKLEQSPWAKEAYTTLKARVDSYLVQTKTDPQWLSSRLFLHWKTHYTTAVVEKSRWVGGEGHAPVPTPRF